MREIFTVSFFTEYTKWTLAPVPFIVPWLLVCYLAHSKDRESSSSLIMALTEPLFTPRDWTNDTFSERFLYNVVMWFVSYFTAFAVYTGARFTRAANFKFNPKIPKVSMMTTEMIRSVGGVLVLTSYQVFVLAGHLRGRTNDLLLDNTGYRIKWLVVVAIWSDFHFYATHRTMHTIPGFYKHIHKVHHLSRNVCPWSGLSMHPLEHLIYFSACLLSLAVREVPFWVTNLICVALTVYPIPAHIGYWPFERHHWDHHTKFNYNYGSSMLWDELLGTTFGPPAKGKKMTQSQRARALEARRQDEITK